VTDNSNLSQSIQLPINPKLDSVRIGDLVT